jgi:hypothetical protein
MVPGLFLGLSAVAILVGCYYVIARLVMKEMSHRR